MNLPNSWHDVKLYQFKELRELKENSGFFNTQLETIAILADVSTDELEDLAIEEVTELFKRVKWVLNEPKKGVSSELEIEGQTYLLKPFKKLTLDEFIDLDYFLQNDYLKHICNIVSIFYKRVEVDKWGNVTFEPYIYSPFERSELFEDVEITKVYGLITDYIKYRADFMRKYENLFQDTNEDVEEKPDIQDFESLEAYKAALKAQEQSKKAKKWGWESLLFDLSDGDITKTKAVGELPLIFVFNMLAMRKEMGYLEASKG